MEYGNKSQEVPKAQYIFIEFIVNMFYAAFFSIVIIILDWAVPKYKHIFFFFSHDLFYIDLIIFPCYNKIKHMSTCI